MYDYYCGIICATLGAMILFHPDMATLACVLAAFAGVCTWPIAKLFVED